jgi:hypothetical protein
MPQISLALKWSEQGEPQQRLNFVDEDTAWGTSRQLVERRVWVQVTEFCRDLRKIQIRHASDKRTMRRPAGQTVAAPYILTILSIPN